MKRRGAKAAGLDHYFTDKPCKRGHLSMRWTSSGACIECRSRMFTHPYILGVRGEPTLLRVLLPEHVDGVAMLAAVGAQFKNAYPLAVNGRRTHIARFPNGWGRAEVAALGRALGWWED